MGPAHFGTQRSVGFLCVEILVDFLFVKEMIWNYFQVQHGKGRADQAGACAVRKLKAEALSNRPLIGVDAMIECLNAVSNRQLSQRLLSTDESSEFGVTGLTYFKDCKQVTQGAPSVADEARSVGATLHTQICSAVSSSVEFWRVDRANDANVAGQVNICINGWVLSHC